MEQYMVVCMGMHYATGPYDLQEAVRISAFLSARAECEFMPVPYKPVLEDTARSHTGQYL